MFLKFKIFLLKTIMIMAPILLLGTFYLISSFIAWDWNPTNWLLYTTTIGRIISVFLFFSYISIIVSLYRDE